MEVITRDTEEVRAYFEALEEGMRYLDTVTAHFRPAMNGEVYLTGEDVCRLLHITPIPRKALRSFSAVTKSSSRRMRW